MTARLALLAGVVLLAAAWAAPSHAGQTRAGDLQIHYNALPTAALPSDSAARYKLAQTPDQGMVIVTVTGPHGNVPATVSGDATTPSGDKLKLSFRRVDQHNAVSSLASFAIPATAPLRFDLSVTPRGQTTTHIQFEQDFVAD